MFFRSDRLVAGIPGAAVCVAVVLVLSLGVSTAHAAAAPAPGWRVLSIPDPTAFSGKQEFGNCVGGCEDKYTILITNVGAVASSGTITVTDTLPAGLTTVETPGIEEKGESHASEDPWQCSPEGAGQSQVICTDSVNDVAPDGGFAQPLRIPVSVGTDVEETLTNEVTVSGGGAAPVSIAWPTSFNPSFLEPFGVADLGSLLAEPDGGADTQADAHPSSFTLNFDANSVINTTTGNFIGPTEPPEDLKDVVIDLPPGLVGDPQATPHCPLSSLVLNSEGINGYGDSACPADTQVGTILFSDGGGYGGLIKGISDDRAVYSMVPEHGYAAEFGFTFAGFSFLLYGSIVGNGAQAHVRVTDPGIPAVGEIPIQGAVTTFFGEDTGSGHTVPFFTNPSQCSDTPLTTTIHLDSYENPGAHNPDGTPDLADPAWKQGESTETPPFTGCADLPFGPSIEAQPTSSVADSPTGLDFRLHVPQSEEPEGLGEADLKNAVVTFPEGLVVNPASAGGLGVCSEAEVGLQDNDPVSCPEASKLGTVEVTTPLLEHPLPGTVYLAAQNANPFHSLLALYIVIDDPQTGVIVKLPGKVSLDPQTGRLTATFDENPQVPFENLKLTFDKPAANGEEPRAPLVTPSSCGTYTTSSDLTPWSTPYTADAPPSSNFEINENCGTPGFAPSFTAGTTSPQAGAFSPFSLTFSRQDGEQTLGGISVTMPPGLLGILKGVVQCPEPQASEGDCGPESLLGESTATVGAGPDPYTVSGGKVYLTGPYNGGSFGLSIVVPTTAGPFTLTGNGGYGREVVRSSIHVNPNTTQVTVISDPLPTILEGVPLQIRTVNVTINRPGFIFNPTNCASSSITGTITSTTGTQSAVSKPFTADNCATLPFDPSFTVSTQGQTSKADGASLTVKVSKRTGEANIHKVDLQLPLVLPARLTTLQKACTEAQFDQNPAGCPEASDIGSATAVTPVLSAPLTGPAYLVSHGGAAFPDVEFVLQGENGIEVVLDGGTDIKKGITYSKFETVPDAPISSFVTTLPEGPHSALAANANLCATSTTKTVSVRKRITVRSHGHTKHITKTVKQTVSTPQSLTIPTTITAQNGAVITQTTKITVTGCPKVKQAAKAKKKAKAKRKAKKT